MRLQGGWLQPGGGGDPRRAPPPLPRRGRWPAAETCRGGGRDLERGSRRRRRRERRVAAWRSGQRGGAQGCPHGRRSYQRGSQHAPPHCRARRCHPRCVVTARAARYRGAEVPHSPPHPSSMPPGANGAARARRRFDGSGARHTPCGGARGRAREWPPPRSGGARRSATCPRRAGRVRGRAGPRARRAPSPQTPLNRVARRARGVGALHRVGRADARMSLRTRGRRASPPLRRGQRGAAARGRRGGAGAHVNLLKVR